MQKWSEKTWFQMLVHQGDFDVKFNDCCTEISDCLGLFSVGAIYPGRLIIEDRPDHLPNGNVGRPE